MREGCADLTLNDGSAWRDTWGDGCATYIQFGDCGDSYYEAFANDGLDADAACCGSPLSPVNLVTLHLDIEAPPRRCGGGVGIASVCVLA